MAEAGGQGSGNQTSPTYFCYTCNREITTVTPDFTCGTCGDGFIEEVPVGAGNPAAPPPLLFGANPGAGGNNFGITITPGGGVTPFFRSSSQPGQGQPPGGVSFDLFDIFSGGLQNLQRGSGAGAGQASGTPTTAETPTTGTTTSTSGPHSHRGGHFSFVIDSRPRTGGAAADGEGTVTITGVGPSNASAAGAARGTGGQGPPGTDNPMENMLYSFLNDLISGLGGQGGANFNITGVPVVGNLGDYVWGRDGLDAIVTQLMNQMEGTGPPPLSEDKVKEIPDVSVTQAQVDCKLQCSVCWDDFTLGEKVKQLDCEHVFHPDCILPWLKLHGTCPICRRDFTEGTTPEHQETSAQANPSNITNSSGSSSNNSNSNNPTNQGAPNPDPNASPLNFLASLASTMSNPNNPFSFMSNSNFNNPASTQQAGNQRQANTTNNTTNSAAGNDGSRSNDGTGNNSSRGTGGGGHLDLDSMEFDFD